MPLEVAHELPDGLFFADGSFARKCIPPALRIPADPSAAPVATRDVVLDEQRGLSARLFLPAGKNTNTAATESARLPVAIYFHGGGFVCFSADSAPFHVLCASIAERVGAVVVSVDYRLAPEDRLPAAYDDGFAALHWLATAGRSDPWLADRADLSRVVLMGDSSGANLAHHVALRAREIDLAAQVVAMVLIQPFYGSSSRLPSETKPQLPGALLSTDLCDRFWDLALQVGTGRDHPYCRFAAPDPEVALPRTLVVAGSEDVLCDRAMEYVSAMELRGRQDDRVELLLVEAGHAFYVVPESKDTIRLLDRISSFINNN